MAIESLTAVEAILIAVSGIITVTLMLGCLALLIMVISKVVAKIEGVTAKEVATEVQPVAVLEEKPDVAYGGETLLIDIDEKTAACVMAIVSDQTGIPLSQLIFKKIRAL